MKEYENALNKKLIDNPFVYHYTSIDALLSILEGFRRNDLYALPFRASSVYNTNDPREMKLGLLCDCIAPFVKSKDWSYEEEFRIVYHKRYEPINDKTIAELPLSLKMQTVKEHIEGIPINAKALEEIIIGPLADFPVDEHILRNELNECMLNDVDITQSSIQIIK